MAALQTRLHIASTPARNGMPGRTTPPGAPGRVERADPDGRMR